MHNFTEDLARSYEERRAELLARRDGVRGEVKRMGASRSTATKALRTRLAADSATRHEVVADELTDFAQARAATSAQQRSMLAQTKAERRAEVTGMLTEARSRREDVRAERMATSLKQRADLTQEVNTLLGEMHEARMAMAAAQREILARDQGCLRTATDALLGDFQRSHQEMAQAQKEARYISRQGLRAEVSKTMQGFRHTRQELATELAEFSQVWKNFAIEMQARHQGGIASQPPVWEDSVEPAPPMVMSTEAVSIAEAPPEIAEVPSEETIFSYLADHPDGVRLVELEAYFSIPRFRLVQIIHRLIQENKARKDDERKLYFAS